MAERERISIQVFKGNLDDVPDTRESCLRVSDTAVGLNSPRT
jgi:hypothetical protein